MQSDLDDVDVVDLDLTSVEWLCHPEEALDDGGFPGAGATDNADFLTRRDGEIEVLQDWSVWGVAERNVAEFDLTLRIEREKVNKDRYLVGR